MSTTLEKYLDYWKISDSYELVTDSTSRAYIYINKAYIQMNSHLDTIHANINHITNGEQYTGKITFNESEIKEYPIEKVYDEIFVDINKEILSRKRFKMESSLQLHHMVSELLKKGYNFRYEFKSIYVLLDIHPIQIELYYKYYDGTYEMDINETPYATGNFDKIFKVLCDICDKKLFP